MWVRVFVKSCKAILNALPGSIRTEEKGTSLKDCVSCKIYITIILTPASTPNRKETESADMHGDAHRTVFQQCQDEGGVHEHLTPRGEASSAAATLRTLHECNWLCEYYRITQVVGEVFFTLSILVRDLFGTGFGTVSGLVRSCVELFGT